MVSCSCVIQEGQISESIFAVLENGLRDIVRRHFDEDTTVTWVPIPEGNGWTGGEPSTTTIVTMQIPDVQQEQRTQVLSDICDLWMEQTGCDINQVVANAANRTQ